MQRTKDEIAGLIMELCKDPASKTRIVYLCNLNSKTVNHHLERLIRAGLLETCGDSIVTYRTTARGLDALENLKTLKGMVGGLLGPSNSRINSRNGTHALNTPEYLLRSGKKARDSC